MKMDCLHSRLCKRRSHTL